MQEQKLEGSGIQHHFHFGHSVAIDGETALEAAARGDYASSREDLADRLADFVSAGSSTVPSGGRITPREREIACLRMAAGYTSAGIRASLAAVAPGVTDNDVVRAGADEAANLAPAIEKALTDRGSGRVVMNLKLHVSISF